ncbi:MAG: organomercurial lyase [Ardenticatenaceae bacterium]|nr:organomercurial lyase [Ardenticatenaceae bacterium]
MAVSTALITGPPIILLDEPTIGLDVEAVRTFKDWIEAAKSRTPSVHNHPKGLTVMSNIEHDTDASLADFMARWRRITTDDTDDTAKLTRGGYALIGLTNFGERPVPSTRLAEVLGWPVSEAEALARHGGWGTRVEDGLITVNPERAPSAPRRHVQIGDRRFGVTGCAPDVFLYAPLVRPSLQLEETCTVTGTPIRLVFTPSGVESVDPSGAVVAMPHPQELDQPESGFDVEECKTDLDGNLCSQCPFYSSAEAAQGWLAAHPGGRVFPVREAWDLSFLREWRDRMSALLNLDT